MQLLASEMLEPILKIMVVTSNDDVEVGEGSEASRRAPSG
jgi:hypothetical protein